MRVNFSSTVCFCALVFLALGSFVSSARAGLITLTDANSTATFNLGDPGDKGLVSWTVDGLNQMKNEWFWYRIGTGAAKTIENLGTMSTLIVTDTNGDGDDDTVSVTYSSLIEKLKVTVSFSLTGGDEGCAALLENSVKISNTATTSQTIHFFQYTDLDMKGTAANDTVQIVNGRDAHQSEGAAFDSASTINPLLLVPTKYEVATDGDILTRLNNGSDLNNQAGPLTGGDATWGFQWDQTIAPNKSITIGQNTSLIPEPMTMLLLAAGGLGLIGRKK